MIFSWSRSGFPIENKVHRELLLLLVLNAFLPPLRVWRSPIIKKKVVEALRETSLMAAKKMELLKIVTTEVPAMLMVFAPPTR